MVSTEIDLPGFSYTTNDVGGSDIPKKSTKKSGGFQSMGLSFNVLKGVTRRGYNIPTPIQRKTIPLIMEGRDVVAMAKTGSGKTACFLIPLFEKLKQRQAKSGARALILSPTRELAIQTFKFIKELGKFMDLKAILILGGDSMDSQFSAIHTSPDIIVATPGRFLHICVEMDLKLNSIAYVVMDEADRLFEMGFGEQLTETLNRLPASKQMIMFSATLPKLMVDFAKAGLSDPVLIRLDVETKIPDALTLKFIYCRPVERYAALLSLLKYTIPRNAQTVVFAGTQHHVELISLLLNKANISNTYIYSTLDPSARKINTAKFAQNKVSVLIVTDVAARGIDIPNLDFVVNLHFPGKPKLFVHRVGRCARAGRTGTAFSIFSTDDQAHLLDLHLFLSRPFNLADSNSVGVIPSDFIEEEHNSVLEWVQDNDIAGVFKTANNAYKHYLQTRPTASIDSNKRIKTMNFFKLRSLDDFKNEEITKLIPHSKQQNVKKTKKRKHIDDDDDKVDQKANFAELLKEDLLLQMKKYRPSGTVFELNAHKQSLSNEVMKQKRVAHQGVIEKFQQKITDAARNEMIMANIKDDDDEASVRLPNSTDDDIKNAFETILQSKKCLNLDSLYKPLRKKNKKSVRDDEHYIPYHAADKHTEDGLAVNSFGQDMHNAEFSVGADTKEGSEISRKLKKWDRIKKKMVSVQDPRQGKIRTESGLWIPATYKTGRYTDWKQKSKIDDLEARNNQNDDNEETSTETRKPLKRVPNTHWAKHNAKMEMKQRQGKDTEIKRPEQITKQRLRVDRIKKQQSDNRQRRERNRKRTEKQKRRKTRSKND